MDNVQALFEQIQKESFSIENGFFDVVEFYNEFGCWPHERLREDEDSEIERMFLFFHQERAACAIHSGYSRYATAA